PRVCDRQAHPVIPVRPRVEGAPIVLGCLAGPTRLIGIAPEARVAARRRLPRVVLARARGELAIPLARRRDVASLVERVRLAGGASGGIVPRGPGRGLHDAR